MTASLYQRGSVALPAFFTREWSPWSAILVGCGLVVSRRLWELRLLPNIVCSSVTLVIYKKMYSNGIEMTGLKKVVFRGDSLAALRLFSVSSRKVAGRQLELVQ